MNFMPATAPAERLDQIQVMRAVAALLVLIGHLQTLLITTAAGKGIALPDMPRIPGGFGVDVFFVISGFIMVVTSRSLEGVPGASSTFLWRRLFRLLPLYWAATLLFVGLRLMSRGDWAAVDGTALLQSLLFLPYRSPDAPEDLAYPLLSLGWTLNYEMQFYLLFGLALAAGRHAHWIVLVVLLAFTALGLLIDPALPALFFWTRPIVLEFGMGVLLGLMWRRQLRFGTPAAWACIAFAVTLLWWDPGNMRSMPAGASTPNDLTRLLAWGLPALALVAAAALHRGDGRARSLALRPLVRLGDWSYALYLMHSFVLGALAKAWTLAPPHSAIGLALGALAAAGLSVLVAGVVHAGFERPTTHWLNQRFLARRAVLRAAHP